MNAQPISHKVDPAAVTHFAERAKELTEFCLARAGSRVFERWPVPTLYAYVFFHLVDRSVMVVREHGQIAAVMFLHAMPAEELQALVQAQRPWWQWRRSRDSADALVLAETIGRRELVSRLVKQARQRWPDLDRKKVFTWRRDQFVELTPDVINIFVGE